MAGKSSAGSPALKPRFRVVCGENIALGPGKVELLAQVDETGSISEAAKRLDMSYNRAWLLIKTMNICFKEPVIAAVRGGHTRGGAELTKTGKKILTLYRQLEIEAREATRKTWSQIESRLKS